MKKETIGSVELTCEDCMELMARYPDKYFDLAIVDPPYGGGNHAMNNLRKPFCGKGGIYAKYANYFDNSSRFGGKFDKYKTVKRTGGSWSAKYGKDINKWDIAPPQKYFDELFRISKNQIIWGGNYFVLPSSRNFIIWEKHIPENFSMAMCEYAWTSINGNAKIFKHRSHDPLRFHPTQKPVQLYKWLLSKYAVPIRERKSDMKILDTHLGSGSSAIACYDMGFSLVGCEIDEDYFTAAVERIKQFAEQGTFEFQSETNQEKENSKLFI